jgi:hypothetical protein
VHKLTRASIDPFVLGGRAHELASHVQRTVPVRNGSSWPARKSRWASQHCLQVLPLVAVARLPGPDLDRPETQTGNAASLAVMDPVVADEKAEPSSCRSFAAAPLAASPLPLRAVALPRMNRHPDR